MSDGFRTIRDDDDAAVHIANDMPPDVAEEADRLAAATDIVGEKLVALARENGVMISRMAMAFETDSGLKGVVAHNSTTGSIVLDLTGALMKIAEASGLDLMSLLYMAAEDAAGAGE